jgi:predicted O-methyltransferase YrrM
MERPTPPPEDRFRAALHEADRWLPTIPVDILRELIDAWRNTGWSAKEEFLDAMTQQAWKAEGTILECGTGLTTLLLGLVARRTRQRVVCVEHLDEWALRARTSLQENSLHDVEVILAPLAPYGEYDWYQLPASTFDRKEIALVVCDGPPEGTRGCRYGVLPLTLPFLRHHAVILLDDVQSGGASVLAQWERDFGLRSTVEGSIKTYGRTIVA